MTIKKISKKIFNVVSSFYIKRKKMSENREDRERERDSIYKGDKTLKQLRQLLEKYTLRVKIYI